MQEDPFGGTKGKYFIEIERFQKDTVATVLLLVEGTTHKQLGEKVEGTKMAVTRYEFDIQKFVQDLEHEAEGNSIQDYELLIYKQTATDIWSCCVQS